MLFMENSSFKSVTFGGFDKQSVIDYIEKTAQTHTAETDELRREAESLREENSSLKEELAALQSKLAEQTAAADTLRTEAEQLRGEVGTLRPLREEAQQLRAEAAALRPDAESYRQFRNRIGDIECEARTRAAEVESTTNARMDRSVAEVRARYQALASSFDSASAYITAELRKVEVNLSQLPRALDQMGSELKSLEGSFQQPKGE